MENVYSGKSYTNVIRSPRPHPIPPVERAAKNQGWTDTGRIIRAQLQTSVLFESPPTAQPPLGNPVSEVTFRGRMEFSPRIHGCRSLLSAVA